ncbi:MAG: deoxyhypusine synthase [Candidatus Methanoliparum thermophilum]|uniref:Deoxyhypusine synthase n=1 Tax=Methanoliparum thermophilum TaxID=2491083 RepID=A0A520KR63_METT2|nr:deoxyhypusine synthase [Candidatus Methanoliparum sp. LAM-1]RZN63844.1 MAG: deoxyhypusine synthase [Candidatus Methanoliparum thermophilum]BDC36431.1 deoxyhypusine synthase [Candidatus Methanoliparum sp. LAM-1]
MKEIDQIRLKKNMNLGEFLSYFKNTAFNSRRLASAVDIYAEMIEKDAKKFFGLAGAMVPAGMRQIIVDMMDRGWIDVLVTTGANLTHDLIEAFGYHHYMNNSNNKEYKHLSDSDLLEEGISRIYDVFITNDAFINFEEDLWKILDDIGEKENISISNLIKEIGARLKDKNSIIGKAYEKDVPIFCPALADSIFGLQVWMYGQTHKFKVGAFDDLNDLTNICFESDKNGVLIVGGGVPKNFILQMMLLKPDSGFDYAIQITMDRPETGGLSGATLEEAVSWGKIKYSGKSAVVYSDATIALPLIYGALIDRFQ